MSNTHLYIEIHEIDIQIAYFPVTYFSVRAIGDVTMPNYKRIKFRQLQRALSTNKGCTFVSKHLERTIFAEYGRFCQ